MFMAPCLRVLRRALNGFRLGKTSNCVDVEIHSSLGFFAQLNWCLYVLAYCEARNIIPKVRMTGPAYALAPGHDWFHDFFEDIESSEVSGTRQPMPQSCSAVSLFIEHIGETTFARTYESTMTIEWAHQLFMRHFQIKTDIATYVDRFITREFDKHGAIGLHFRGTDKKIEANPVDWTRCFQAVTKYALSNPGVTKVFVSSDDPFFIEWFANQANGTLSVILHPDRERSRNGLPVHAITGGDGYRKGFEALVNCLILSRCVALIRTASFLSGWSSIFNPLVPITLLNGPFVHTRWFPDRELMQRSDDRYR